MSTVLQFRASSRMDTRRPLSLGDGACEIVIFPGVRIERHDSGADLDLGHRLHDPSGDDSFGGLGGGRRPRQNS